MSGDIGDQDAHALLVDTKKIVEIAGDSAHGHIARGNFQSLEGGNTLRKRGSLYPASNFQLFANGEESFFIGEDPVCGHVAESRDENQEAKKFHVAPTQNPKTQEICMDNEQKPDEKSHD